MNNMNKNSVVDYSDWGWYIDIEHIETSSCYKYVPPSPMKLKCNYVIDIYDNNEIDYEIDNEIDDTKIELTLIKKQLFSDCNTLSEF